MSRPGGPTAPHTGTTTAAQASPAIAGPRSAGTTRANAAIWTFVITAMASFMSALDNLVVTTALPSIRAHLHAGLGGLEWTVNAYTLTFAVLLLTGASLGDRFGRKRFFVIGLSIFTLGSAGAALAPGINALVAARALQGIGGAILTPLTLTLLAAAVPPERRGLALGAWGAISGLAVACGPVIGGAIVEAASWQWIFWVNVPIGLVLLPLAARHIHESRGPAAQLDLPGVGLASAGLFGIVFALVRSTSLGWTAPEVGGWLVMGLALLAGFGVWEGRTPHPMLPLRLFRSRAFSSANAASLLMSFGMFGSIFLLAQFLQIVQGESPLQAGLRTLPWTAMPVLVAAPAGILAQRIGGRPVLATGLFLQAVGLTWVAVVTTPTVAYLELVPAFILSGIGMALFFAPMAGTVLASVAASEEGIASGVNNALRELGGVLGIAVLASVFAARGGYASGHDFVSGLSPAVAVGAGLVFLAVAAALLIPRASASIIRRPGGLEAELPADVEAPPPAPAPRVATVA